MLSQELNSKLNNDDIEAELYVIRTNKQNQLRNSKPCRRCIEFMNNFVKCQPLKIKKIYYSIDDDLIETTLDELNNEENKHIPKSERDWWINFKK